MASTHGVDINSIPFAIYSPSINGDLSSFLGIYNLKKVGMMNKLEIYRWNQL